ncbi:MAG: hypothetical protein GKS06_09000 [Acidobacteria bacterium]|nr:hypothetical protein [Acidobacteriota bacterium]
MRLSRLIPLALVAILLAPTAVLAHGESMHLRLTKSAPTKDAVVEASPAEIRLWFSLPPELAVSRIKLTAADGTEMEVGELTAGEENTIYAALAADIPPGAYEVSWRTSSGDGHPITGTFAFEVGATR